MCSSSALIHVYPGTPHWPVSPALAGRLVDTAVISTFSGRLDSTLINRSFLMSLIIVATVKANVGRSVCSDRTQGGGGGGSSGGGRGIVFVAGGATHSELRSAYEAAEQHRRDVIIGVCVCVCVCCSLR